MKSKEQEIILDKIYKLLNLPIVTPYNLLENAKLDNYKYVKYYKNGQNGNLITEMKCTVNEEDIVFKYEFDSKDYLNKIYMKNSNKVEYIFKRELELQLEKEKYMANII